MITAHVTHVTITESGGQTSPLMSYIKHHAAGVGLKTPSCTSSDCAEVCFLSKGREVHLFSKVKKLFFNNMLIQVINGQNELLSVPEQENKGNKR